MSPTLREPRAATAMAASSAASVIGTESARMPVPATTSQRAPSASSDSKTWLDALRSTGTAREGAVESLHGLLLRAARHEVSKRRAALSHVRGEELEDVASQAAADALMAVLAKLDGFRGESRFTTWAYKFALLEAGMRLRRRAWQHREVVLDSDSWMRFAEPAAGPTGDSERAELMRTLRECIGAELTPHQRQVLVALALDGVPIDVLAERLGATRGALYKTLHDARRKLRAALEVRGFSIEDTDR